MRRGFVEPFRYFLNWEKIRGKDWSLLSIGEDCIVKSHLRWESSSQGIKIGPNTYIGSDTSLNSIKGITIGSDVLISNNCFISDSDGHSIDFKKRKEDVPNRWKGFKDWSDISSDAIKIKDGVWIGAYSIVLKGVTIGKRTIIGAGSVVTKDIPNDVVAAGNPAKIIRRLLPNESF